MVRYSSISRHPLVVSLIAGLLFIAIMIGFAPQAQATAGDFCQKVKLSPGTTCWGGSDGFPTEMESWSENGAASCVGIGTGSGNGTGEWYAHNCASSDGSPPNEIYCIEACSGKLGWPFVHDHSGSKSDNFTGWWVH
jgi:hypothetical protein